MRPTPYFRETNTLHNAYVNSVGLSSLHGNHPLSYEFECYTVQKYDNYASGTSSSLSVMRLVAIVYIGTLSESSPYLFLDRLASVKPLSHQGGVLTVIPRRPKKMQNAEVRTVRTHASPQQRSGIAIGRGGIA